MTAAEVNSDSSKKGFKSAMRALSPGRTREPQGDDGRVGNPGDKGDTISPSKSWRGKEKKKPQADGDDGSAESPENKGDKSSPTGKSWFGKETKKPRAEYQAEIDDLQSDLQSKITALEEIKADRDSVKADRDRQAARVNQLTQQVNSFNMWVRQAPRVS